MEVKHLLVPGGGSFHLAIRLVSDTVIDELKFGWGHDFIKCLFLWVFLEAGKMSSFVVNTLNKGVDGISVSSYGGHDDYSVLILIFLGRADRLGTSLDGLVVNASGIINGESDVLNSITVLVDVFGE